MGKAADLWREWASELYVDDLSGLGRVLVPPSDATLRAGIGSELEAARRISEERADLRRSRESMARTSRELHDELDGLKIELEAERDLRRALAEAEEGAAAELGNLEVSRALELERLEALVSPPVRSDTPASVHTRWLGALAWVEHLVRKYDDALARTRILERRLQMMMEVGAGTATASPTPPGRKTVRRILCRKTAERSSNENRSHSTSNPHRRGGRAW